MANAPGGKLPRWRRNKVLEYAVSSALGRPVVTGSKYDPTGRRLTVTIGSDSPVARNFRSEEHTSELQSLMRISYAVFCLKKKKNYTTQTKHKIIITPPK